MPSGRPKRRLKPWSSEWCLEVFRPSFASLLPVTLRWYGGMPFALLADISENRCGEKTDEAEEMSQERSLRLAQNHADKDSLASWHSVSISIFEFLQQ